MRWIRPTVNPALPDRLARDQGISPLLARLLAARGLRHPEAVRAFLSPSLKMLADPLQVGGMPEAVARIEGALRRQESVLIFGDYDVDGVTSTVFLTHFLRRFGLSPRYIVPRRLQEGYGLSLDSLRRALADGRPDLLIAVDCGTSSVAEVAWLRRQGTAVIILDHHTSREALPADCILVNPHVRDDPAAPWLELCAVGLVFKFCHALLRVLRQQGDALAEATDLREYFDLVALGTVADLVPLTGENRILVRHGLERLRQCQRPGICALMEVAGMSLGEEVTPFDIGFKLGPRINASGRLDDATLPIQLLLSEEWSSCHETARVLDAFNRERQEIERAIAQEAEEQAMALYANDSGIIVHSPDWHAGVVGIVASRLARKFNRPTLVLGSDGDGLLKGSGRSIDGVNLVEILKLCTDHIVQWGGHPMAVGLTTGPSDLEQLRQAFNESLQARFPDGLPEPAVTIDAPARPEELTESLLQELERLAPFGQGNPEPVFAVQDAVLSGCSTMGQDHCRFSLARGGALPPLDGVAWNMAKEPPPVGQPLELAARFHWHAYRGQRFPRLTLIDWRAARAAPRTAP